MRMRRVLKEARSVEAAIVEEVIAWHTPMERLMNECFTAIAVDLLTFIKHERNQGMVVVEMFFLL